MSLLERHEVTVSKLFKGVYTSRSFSAKLYTIEIEVLHELKPSNIHTHNYPRNNKLMLSGLKIQNKIKQKPDYYSIVQIVHLQMNFLGDTGSTVRHIGNNSSSTISSPAVRIQCKCY